MSVTFGRIAAWFNIFYGAAMLAFLLAGDPQSKFVSVCGWIIGMCGWGNYLIAVWRRP